MRFRDFREIKLSGSAIWQFLGCRRRNPRSLFLFEGFSNSVMAPKRPNPLENPPAASSSEDEEQDESSSAEETDRDEKTEGMASDDDADSPVKKPKTIIRMGVKTSNLKSAALESEAESESESESEPKTTKSDAVKPLASKPRIVIHMAAKTSNIKSAALESEAESESESESEPEATKSDAVKPLASKPMPGTSDSRKSGSSVVGFLENSPAKRPSTELGKDDNQLKRAKKAAESKKPEEDEGKKTGEDAKKQLFQRLFSEDDEIAVLQGILEFTATNGDPYDHMDEFCELVKRSINFNASKAQLFDKIRRLKRKFENSVKKSVGKGKNGEERVFSKAHDQKAFDLWKKIWGSDGALQSASKSASKSKKNQGGNFKGLAHAGNELSAAPKKGEVNTKGEKEAVSKYGQTHSSNEGISGRDMASLFKMENSDGFDELAVLQGWDLADGPEKIEIEEKWKKIRTAQMELFLMRNEFISEATKLILESLKINVPDSGH